MQARFDEVIFCHVNRDQNNFAHKLARKGLFSCSNLWIHNFPNWIVNLVASEKSLFVLSLGISYD